MQGIIAQPQNTSTGTVSGMYGVQGLPQNVGGGAITTMYGVVGLPTKSGTGTVTTMHGLYSRCDNTNATGAVTSCYGLYLATPTTTGAITNKYGVYQQDSASNNYYAGNVGIGTGAPVQPLEVVDSATGIIAPIFIRNAATAANNNGVRIVFIFPSQPNSSARPWRPWARSIRVGS